MSTAKPPYAASTWSQSPTSRQTSRELRERVDRAGVRRAAVRRDEERHAARAHVGLDRAPERLRRRAGSRADGQHADLVGPEAEHARAAGERRVRLVGDVGDEPVVHRADARLARAGERGHVRGRAAAERASRRALGQADPAAEPVEHLELELRRAGRLHPRPRVDVARARDEVAERAGPRARERDEREEGGVLAAAREREDVLAEAAQELVERLRLARAAGPTRRARISAGVARRSGGTVSSSSRSTSMSTVR